MSARLVARLGTERTILIGTALCVLGSTGQLAYAVPGGSAPLVILALFAPVNIGLGLRGPPGLYRAVVAAIGTALASPLIERGTVPLAGIALGLHAAALLCLVALPALSSDEDT